MTLPALSRREREIMDILYRGELLTVQEILDRMSEAPSYSAVRALLRILEDKGHVRHAENGPRYVYSPVVPKEKARRSAVKALVKTFFGGSAEDAVAALIDESKGKLSEAELDRLAAMIDAARKEGR